MMGFNITTKAFEYGSAFPAEHTCDGENISPPLRWSEVPGGTVTFALILEDPDAASGTFTHWIVYNLPSECHELGKIGPFTKKFKNRAIQGKNDFGKYGYNGPCPPKGENHRYFFILFALNKKLAPESANDRESFYEAIKGHIIEEAFYMGTYKRKRK